MLKKEKEMKRNINLYLVACMLCVAQAPVQAENIFSKTWNKAKKSAQSSYNKAKKGWDSLDGKTKKAIKKALVAAGATAVAAGATYYGYDQYGSNMQMQTRPGFTQDQATMDELIAFLSTDPSYKGNPLNQRMFLNRFRDQGLTEDEIRNILDIVAMETGPAVPVRDY